MVHPLGIGPKALAASESGYPWVVTVNGAQAAETQAVGGLRNRIRAAVFRRLEEESLRRAHTIIVPNPVVRSMLGARIRHARVFTIENAVDELFFELPDGGDLSRIVCVSRVIPHKRPELLVEAARRVKDAGRDFRLRWIGPADHDSFLEALRAQAEAGGLGDRFTFVGFVSDEELRRELVEAGLMVLPSAVEIAPISVMQAMASGVARDRHRRGRDATPGGRRPDRPARSAGRRGGPHGRAHRRPGRPRRDPGAGPGGPSRGAGALPREPGRRSHAGSLRNGRAPPRRPRSHWIERP